MYRHEVSFRGSISRYSISPVVPFIHMIQLVHLMDSGLRLITQVHSTFVPYLFINDKQYFITPTQPCDWRFRLSRITWAILGGYPKPLERLELELTVPRSLVWEKHGIVLHQTTLLTYHSTRLCTTRTYTDIREHTLASTVI